MNVMVLPFEKEREQQQSLLDELDNDILIERDEEEEETEHAEIEIYSSYTQSTANSLHYEIYSHSEDASTFYSEENDDAKKNLDKIAFAEIVDDEEDEQPEEEEEEETEYLTDDHHVDDRGDEPSEYFDDARFALLAQQILDEPSPFTRNEVGYDFGYHPCPPL